MDLYLYFISGCAVTACIMFFFNKKQLKMVNSELIDEINKNRQLEKDVHLHEAKFLEEKNKLVMENYHILRDAKQKSFDEGYTRGKEDSLKDFLIKKGELDRDYQDKERKVEIESFEMGRKKAQVDFEEHSSAFTVSISPYVIIKTDKGIFSDTYLSEIGYKYQLLVKGIPAFQPHICVEKSEEIKEVNEERIQKLSDLAITLTETAIGSYLGSMPSSLIKLGNTVVTNTVV